MSIHRMHAMQSANQSCRPLALLGNGLLVIAMRETEGRREHQRSVCPLSIVSLQGPKQSLPARTCIVASTKRRRFSRWERRYAMCCSHHRMQFPVHSADGAAAQWIEKTSVCQVGNHIWSARVPDKAGAEPERAIRCSLDGVAQWWWATLCHAQHHLARGTRATCRSLILTLHSHLLF